jgi:hypothetical protein
LIIKAKRLDGSPATLGCAVCGREPGDGLGWFLVVEDSWLDRLKVLHWHPILAEQEEMRGVCGKPHLKTLLIHWLTRANLQFAASEAFRLPASSNGGMTVAGSAAAFVTSLVGELAVYREPLSRVWTGSPQALECILEALLGGLTRELPQPAKTGLAEELPEFAMLKLPPDGSRDYALQSHATGA